MDFSRQPEARGGDNPRQEPSIEPRDNGPGPLNSVSRNFTVISNPSPPAAPAQHHFPLWLRRIMLFIKVAFAVEVGMFLVVLPWYDGGRIWTENSLLLAYPNLRAFLAQNFIRGLVSGIGLIDIWVGIWEAVHYREVIHR